MPDTHQTELVKLSDRLISEAKQLGVDISQAAETGIVEAIKKRKEDDWLAENRAALDSWNAYVEKNGLPLEQFRLF